MINYVWTKKAEERAKELGLEERKAGTPATYGYDPVGLFSIANNWLRSGYIEKAN